MKDNLRESLSALMDNEGDELELRRVLKTLGDSPDDAEAWRRYHLARSLMQRDRDIDISTDLAAGVMARIQDEPAPQASEEAHSRRHSLSFAGSAAVAAAVSLMVITGVQFYHGIDSTPSSDMAGGTVNGGGLNRDAAGSGVQPASSSALDGSSVVDLPFLQSLPMSGNGVMTVGAGGDMPLFMAPNQRQSQRADLEQAHLLQSYLDRHAGDAAYRSGEAWMPLLRASSQDALSPR